MILVHVQDKVIEIPIGVPLNIVYLELQNLWRNATKVESDMLKIQKFPLTFEVDHVTATVIYKCINQWILKEVE
jgi:hypothetical protein